MRRILLSSATRATWRCGTSCLNVFRRRLRVVRGKPSRARGMTRHALAFMVVAMAVTSHLFAQAPPAQPGGGRAAGPPTGIPGGGFGGGRGAGRGGRGGAPFDMTGYWVSVVGEDWRWRMFPVRGDYGAVPLNQAARKIADTWDAS